MFKSPAVLGRKLSDIGVPSQALASLPRPMQRAVRLMLIGASVTAVWGLFFIIAAAVDTSGAVGPDGKKISSGSLAAEIVFLAVEAVIYVALWVLMARKCQSGRNWARITASVLFVLWSYQTYGTLGTTGSSPAIIVNLVFVIGIWLIGLGALFMLWQQESSAFFRGNRV
jgi:uncharacterized membrane protein